MLYKNVASQKLAVYAHDTSADTAKTGDAANITAQISIDGAATAATNDTNPTELDATDAPGVYIFDLTQAETNGDLIILAAVSSTADIQIEPVFAYTAGVDVTYISGDSTAADSLESQYDGTGLAGDTYPATQAQLSGISISGSAVNTTADSYTLTTGTQSSGTVANTEALDGVSHQHTDDAGTMDLYYEFLIGASSPSQVIAHEALTGKNDDLGVYGYDWVASAWVQIGTLEGKVSSAIVNNTYNLTTAMVGTGADIGKVRIRYYATGLTTSTLYIDQLLVAFNLATGGYTDGIEVDTNASNTNTVPGVDGVKGNPVSTWAAALTLSSSTGIAEFKIINGSSITLSGNSDNYTMEGKNWSLALGGQSIDDISVCGAHITGIGTAAADHQPHMRDCLFGAVTLPPCILEDCGIGEDDGLFTGGLAGQYIFKDCFSLVAGSGTPDLTFAGLAATTGVNVRGWKGGSSWTLDSDCTVSHEVLAGGGQTFTTGGGNVELRGIFRAATFTLSGAGTVQVIGITGPITLSGTATSTVNIYGSYNSLSDTSTGTTVNATPNQVNSTYIEDYLLTGKVGDNFTTFFENAGVTSAKTVDQVGSTAIRTGTAQDGAATSITLDASASATDNLYLDTVIIITGGTGAGQVNSITAYDGTTKIATVLKTWETTPDATSTFELQPASSMIRYIMAMASGKLSFSGNVVSVYDQDNTTLLYTNTWSQTGRTRS